MYHMKQHRHRMADARSFIFDMEYTYKYNVIFGSTLFPASYATCFRNLAPAHNTGAKCRDMLNPNSDANHKIVKIAMGTSRSSV